MWINRDVDMPPELIAAQREGRLVVFAGAGVSMGTPSNLPSFPVLANLIAAGTLAPKDGEALDAFLGRAEQYGIDVQARARQFIDAEGSTPKQLHHSLIGLFRDPSVLRLVTTNFDRHFTTALRAQHADVEIFTAPALPLGHDWDGLVYLHGAVEKPRSHLVVTDRDFGQAYLADAWATRFLMGMFQRYVVLFVGYRHADPVMKYLARSFIGGTSRFALGLPGEDDHWVHLGITPIHFPERPAPDRYGALDDAIESWTTIARRGVFDHQIRVSQLVALPPPLEPETLDYLRTVVDSPVTLRFFVQQATRIEWLEWAKSEGILTPLLRPEPLSADRGALLADWFARQFAVQHARSALGFVQPHLTTLNPQCADAIAFRVALSASPLTEGVLRGWAAALTAAETTNPYSLTRLLRRCGEDGDIETTLTLFRALLRPRLRFDPAWSMLDRRERLMLDIEVQLRGEPYDLRDVWEHTLSQHIALCAREWFALVTDWIYESWGLLRAAGKGHDTWDPLSESRAAIEPYAQDHTDDSWGLVIDIARAVLDWAVVEHPHLAEATIASWLGATPLLLQRLAIYGTARRTDLAPSDALDLIARHEWLYASTLKHETFGLLEAVFARADEGAQRRFIDYSMTAAVLPQATPVTPEVTRTIDYERYNVAAWLAQVAPDVTAAHEHLAVLQQQHPEFEQRSHPDMDGWISTGWVGTRSPVSAEELLAMTAGDAAPYLATYQPNPPTFDGPDRSGLMTIFGQAAVQNRPWGLDVAEALITSNTWAGDVWSALLHAWRTGPLSDAGTCHEILAVLETHQPILAAAPIDAAHLIEDIVGNKDLVEDDLVRVDRIAEQLLAVSDTMPPGVHTNGEIDWLTSAINHPAGEVAMAWLKTLSRRMTVAGETWTGLSQEARMRFEALLTGNGHNAVLARVVFASRVPFLFSADRSWTEANVVPLFEWTTDGNRARQAWHGFLTWGQWNDPLFEQMLPFTRQTITRVDQLGDQARDFVTALANVAAYSQRDPWNDDGWLLQFVREASEPHRADWAKTFGRSLEAMQPEGRTAVWQRWLSVYWDARITGVGQPLGATEREAMLAWLCQLKQHFTEVADRTIGAPASVLDHFTLYRLKECGLAESHGAEVGRLFARLMPAITGIRHDSGELFDLAADALNHGADRTDIRVIAEEMLRLGCTHADRLAALTNGGAQ